MKKFVLWAAVSALVLSCSNPVLENSTLNGLEAQDRALAPAVQLDVAQSNLINLGSAYLVGQISGLIDVENLSSTKTVVVRYTLDGTTWKNTPAYFRQSLGNNRESWGFAVEAFNLPYAYTVPSVTMKFAVSMTANGQTYWDNNGGKDYAIGTKGSGQTVPVIALGKRALKLEGAHYGSVYPAGTVLDLTASVKNLVYTKDVVLVYTKDNWKTTLTSKLNWVQNYSAAQEQWRASLVIDAYNPGAANNTWTNEIKFCLAYNVNGTTYWDNAEGQNYSITAGYTFE